MTMISKSEKTKYSEAKLWSSASWYGGLGKGTVSHCFPPEQREPISCGNAVVSVCRFQTSVSFSLSIWSVRRGSSHSAASWKCVSQIEALDT